MFILNNGSIFDNPSRAVERLFRAIANDSMLEKELTSSNDSDSEDVAETHTAIKSSNMINFYNIQTDGDSVIITVLAPGFKAKDKKTINIDHFNNKIKIVGSTTDPIAKLFFETGNLDLEIFGDFVNAEILTLRWLNDSVFQICLRKQMKDSKTRFSL